MEPMRESMMLSKEGPVPVVVAPDMKDNSIQEHIIHYNQMNSDHISSHNDQVDINFDFHSNNNSLVHMVTRHYMSAKESKVRNEKKNL